VRDISEALQLTEDQTASILAALQDLGLIAAAQIRQREHWVLVCDPSSTSLTPLLAQFFVNRRTLQLDEQPALKHALSIYIQDNQDSILGDVLLQNDNTNKLNVQSDQSSKKETHHATGQ
jgi:hypothetical protein